MFSDALAIEQRFSTLSDESEFFVRLKKAYAASGYTAVVREELNKDLEDRARGKYRNPVGVAREYALLGDDEDALEWLEKAYEERSSGMQYLAVDPQFDALRSNPKFQYWLGVLGLPSLKIPAAPSSPQA